MSSFFVGESFFAEDLGRHEIPVAYCRCATFHFLLFTWHAMLEMEEVIEKVHDIDFNLATIRELAGMEKFLLEWFRMREIGSGMAAAFGEVVRPRRERYIPVLNVPLKGWRAEHTLVPTFPRQSGWTVLVYR
jgi:hypothetical protein